MSERDWRTDQIVEAWNLMGGSLDWQALPIVCEMLSVEDPDLLVRGLAQIREHFREVERATAQH